MSDWFDTYGGEFLFIIGVSVFFVLLTVIVLFSVNHVNNASVIHDCIKHGMQWVHGSCVKK